MATYEFDKELILRTPLLPYTSVTNNLKNKAYLTDKGFLEALFLASPDLFELYNRKGNSKEFEMTVLKYYLRASTRTTPFGLFAGLNLIPWQSNNGKGISIHGFNRFTELDISSLNLICKTITNDENVRHEIRLYPNASIYRIDDKYRYIEFRESESSKFTLSSFDYSPTAANIISFCTKGRTFREIVDYLTAEFVAEGDSINSFIEEMISNGILIYELYPYLIGDNPLSKLIGILESIRSHNNANAIDRYLSSIREIFILLNEIDKQEVENMTNYYKLKEHVERAFEIKIPHNRLFNVSMLPIYQGGLDKHFQRNIIDGLQILTAINSHLVPFSKLKDFIDRFTTRYETQEKSLLAVLDHENGIGYSDISISGEFMSGLMKHVKSASQNAEEISANAFTSFLLNKVLESQRIRSLEIEIDEKEIAIHAKTKNPKKKIGNISVFFRIADNIIYLESASALGVVNTITRFGTLDKGIERLCREYSPIHSEDNNHIYAEISHYPDAVSGNILRRPKLTTHLISVILPTASNSQHEIPLNDILISVQGGEIVLRSKRLKKVIIPILSSAYNFSGQKNLPIFQFLCDLQTQEEKTILAFQWPKSFKDITFLPRLSFKSCILSLATWNIKDDDLVVFLSEIKAIKNKVKTPFIKLWSIPERFIIVDGDNELYIDLSADISRQVAVNMLSKRDSIVIKEVFLSDKDIIYSENGGFANQFVAYLKEESHKEDPIAHSSKYTLFKNKAYYPISEWIYIKVYCGGIASDQILAGPLNTIIKKLITRGLIEKWFFIRYADPEYHLRVRFSVKERVNVSLVNEIINHHLEPLLKRDKIWKIQFDTYIPELERYRFLGMHTTEKIFFLSSNITLKLLKKEQGVVDENTRILLSMKLVDSILSAAQYNLKDKLSLVIFFRTSLEREYDIATDFWKMIDMQFKMQRKVIIEYLQPDLSGNNINRLYNEYVSVLTSLFENMNPSIELQEYLFSLCHMQVNRLFIDHQKINEVVTYQMLFKYYSLLLYSKADCNTLKNQKPEQL